jgi:FAD/FMN-containing dehydrogenase
MREMIAGWAREQGIACAEPDDFVVRPEITDRSNILAEHFSDFDFMANPCIDFGRLEERIPDVVVRPANVDQLRACVVFFAENEVPYKVRAAAMSSGGQSLMSGGAILDTSALSDIAEDQPDEELIRVSGGARWLDVVEHLAPLGRRPVTLTANPRSTVAGTLAVGGFGDTTHLIGPQICSVTALTLLTPDGELHTLGPDDELFRYTLAGRGQLGIIVDATIRTVQKPLVFQVRRVVWKTLQAYVRDMMSICGYNLYEFVRAWVSDSPDDPDGVVIGLVGHAREDLPVRDASFDFISPDVARPFERLDLLAAFRKDITPQWNHACPALEMALPMPAGLETWRQIYQRVRNEGLAKSLRPGAAVMLTPRAKNLPLAPLADSDRSLVAVVRPQLGPAEAAAAVPLMRELGAMALDAGARLYLIGVEPDTPNFLEQQFGSHLDTFKKLKAQVDPKGLCNPGLLVPEPGAAAAS